MSIFKTCYFAEPKNKGNFGRNEPPAQMKFMRYVLVLSALLFHALAPPLFAQDVTKGRHDHAIYQQIENAYQKGRLSLDKKVLFKFYATSSPDKLPAEFRPKDSFIQKCGTPATSDYHKNKAKLSPATVSEIESMMPEARMQSSETYQSPSGRFRIHYETTGPNAPPPGDQNSNGIPDYVEEAGKAADSTYRHEVQRLGYTNPIPSGNSYSIYILNSPCGNTACYGRTVSDGTNTYIEIENDFQGFPENDAEDPQLGALKVTIAHEFKHAIHFTANQWRGETADWLEMDATLMEEVVYDNVNDYYNYITWDNSIFNNPSDGFYPGSYEHVSWALYFEQRYGSQFWVNVWKIIKDNPFITMIEAITQQLGGPEAYNRNFIVSQLWHFASGANSSPNFGFEESKNYPSPPIQTEEKFYNKNFTIPRSSPADTLNLLSAQYYKIPVSAQTKGEISLDITKQNASEGIGLIAYYQDGSVQSSAITSTSSNQPLKTSTLNWENIDQLGLVLTNSSTTASGASTEPMIVGVGSDNLNSTLSQNYPNPFNPQTRIRFTLQQSSQVELKIYNSAGQLVQTLFDGKQLSAGLYEPVFDGSGLASGVYFYQLKTDQQTFVKKMTLVK